jgi:hypothetical protein
MRWFRHFCNLRRFVCPYLATVYRDALPWKDCDALPCAPVEIRLCGLMPLFGGGIS